jgi:hypothetical protein
VRRCGFMQLAPWLDRVGWQGVDPPGCMWKLWVVRTSPSGLRAAVERRVVVRLNRRSSLALCSAPERDYSSRTWTQLVA